MVSLPRSPGEVASAAKPPWPEGGYPYLFFAGAAFAGAAFLPFAGAGAAAPSLASCRVRRDLRRAALFG